MSKFGIFQCNRYAAQLSRAEQIRDAVTQVRVSLEQDKPEGEINKYIWELYCLFNIRTMPDRCCAERDDLLAEIKSIEKGANRIITDMDDEMVDLEGVENSLVDLDEVIKELGFIKKDNGDGTTTS